MTVGGHDPQLGRALDFLARVDDAVAAELVELEFGVGVFDPRRPLVWDANYVRVTDRGPSAEVLAEEAERLGAERGLAHRMAVLVDQAEGRGVAEGFAELGWEPAHHTVMPLAEPRAAGDMDVEEISFDELAGAVGQLERIEPPGGSSGERLDQVLDQLASRDGLIASVVAERRFAIRANDEPVSWCRLYSRDGVGQIENVATHPDNRRRGLAAAVVAHAARASVRAGNEFTFIVAETGSAAVRLYERLGFESAGTIYRYRRVRPSPSAEGASG